MMSYLEHIIMICPITGSDPNHKAEILSVITDQFCNILNAVYN